MKVINKTPMRPLHDGDLPVPPASSLHLIFEQGRISSMPSHITAAALDASSEERSEDDGMPEHPLKAADALKWAADRGKRVADAEPGPGLPELEKGRRITCEEIRTDAYFLWEADGCKEGMAETYWIQARDRIKADRRFLTISETSFPT
ncbi:DUF2934 domain-containing protein [Teichococcus deserti]|uniref:DUF2934 domain-containing protein n=1 Tax=Teichococcus deserti TaxID=1817963 RepID=UPI001A969D82|nr:DUF2934 domain-containing protein [Pseudoroseomonas deserti]